MNSILLPKRFSSWVVIVFDLIKIIIFPTVAVTIVTLPYYSSVNSYFANPYFAVVFLSYLHIVRSMGTLRPSDPDFIKEIKHAIHPSSKKRGFIKAWWFGVSVFCLFSFLWYVKHDTMSVDTTLIAVGISIFCFIVMMFRNHNLANKRYLMVMDDREQAVEIEKIPSRISTLAGVIDVSAVGGAVKKSGKFFDYFKFDDYALFGNDQESYLLKTTAMKTE